MEVRESAEDYLETILLLTKKTGEVRSINIVEEMGFSKPSVSIAMKKLRTKGLIEMDNDGYITLTDEGMQQASTVYDRHATLYDWLISIGVGKKQAAKDACRMEHVISEETFRKIKEINISASAAK
ncbi:MAG: metal-dependent transcriptional regulator [Lachnospiraceae bacterium]|jgi:Mn-dependent DtxR family transcriptional regulator|nr:metal-dependent transcriptional regulator [Lachnospiraceae bacterium]